MKTGPKADKPAASRVTKIEGKKLHYLTAGQGPALILLHGYTQTSRMWRPLIDKLRDKFTVIAPDLPGIGDSDIPKDGCDMKTAAIRIHALAKSIGVTKARGVGHYIGLREANDARSAHRWRKSQRRNSSPADEACGYHRHRGRLERYWALAHGRAA